MKVGWILPSVAALPSDISLLMPADVEALVVTLNGRNGMPGEKERVLEAMQQAVDVLIDEGASAMVVAGVPVAARRGYAQDREALAALTLPRGATPIVSSLCAIGRALQLLGSRHPLFITQYADALNAAILAYCAQMGVSGGRAYGLGAGNAGQVNALSQDDFDQLARRAMARHPETDCIIICARASMVRLVRALEAALGIPVIEQTQACVLWSATELGFPLPVSQDRIFAIA